ncbi:MAG TPA: ABC-2 transporter permease [Devosia sp.]|jgi:ABC-2 type transport system permease protein|nr:ABC-2 transporter permease [Devosia sp.]
MKTIRSWTALLNREYLEHRMAFIYFPIGILVLLAFSAASGLMFNRAQFDIPLGPGTPSTLKFFELGYLLLAALWLVYLAVALFFYFGDAFSADRRNNAMYFWKSMPVTDFKILMSKFFSGTLLFPLILFVVTLVSGLLYFVVINLAPLVVPGLILPSPVDALMSFINISVFALVYTALALLWYAPFFAWVGALSAVFGRWSLVLAFLVPGLLAVVENIVFIGHIPRGGYIWGYLSQRLSFGLSEPDYMAMLIPLRSFGAPEYVGRLWSHIDWIGMGTGVVFTLVVLWLASEYRRRRIA